MVSRLQPRLPDPRVQPEVTHQFLRRSKPPDVPNGRDHTEGHGLIDARDGHQALGSGLAQGDLCQVTINRRHIGAGKVQRAQQALDGAVLVSRQGLLTQPGTPFLTEEIRGWAPRHQIPMQDRVNLVLQSRAVADELGSPTYLAPELLGRLIGHPHLRQEPRRVELRQHGGVDLVRLHLGVGDGAGAQRIRDHDAARVAVQHAHDRVRVPGRLEDHLVRRRETVREDLHRLPGELDTARVPDHPVLPDRHFRKRPMYVAFTPCAHEVPT